MIGVLRSPADSKLLEGYCSQLISLSSVLRATRLASPHDGDRNGSHISRPEIFVISSLP
jgi:hypothetical protein